MLKTYPPLDGAASSSSLQTRSADEEETSSICCDIYIDGEEQRPNPKHGGKTKPLHVTAIMRGMHKAERPLPPGGAGEQQKKRGCSCFVLILCITAVVAVAVTVGVTVGERRKEAINLRASSWVGCLLGCAFQGFQLLTIKVSYTNRKVIYALAHFFHCCHAQPGRCSKVSLNSPAFAVLSAGMTKHKKKQPAVVLPNPQTGPALSASVTISVPFGASTKLEYPGGHNSLTCDDLFGDQQVCLWV